jgi:hypothetical protein
MRPFFVIVVFEFLAKEVHVFVAKDDEMVETFLLDRLNESLGKGDHIGRSDRSSLGFDSSILEGIQEWLGVLIVVVDQQGLAFRA